MRYLSRARDALALSVPGDPENNGAGSGAGVAINVIAVILRGFLRRRTARATCCCTACIGSERSAPRLPASVATASTTGLADVIETALTVSIANIRRRDHERYPAM